MKLINVSNNYLSKYPELKTHIDEWRQGQVFALLVDGEAVCIAVVSCGRIHHIYTPEAVRGASYATAMLSELVERVTFNGSLIAAVPPENIPAVKLFIKSKFRINGFNRTFGDKRYVLEYRYDYNAVTHDGNKLLEGDVEQLAKNIYLPE